MTQTDYCELIVQLRTPDEMLLGADFMRKLEAWRGKPKPVDGSPQKLQEAVAKQPAQPDEDTGPANDASEPEIEVVEADPEPEKPKQLRAKKAQDAAEAMIAQYSGADDAHMEDPVWQQLPIKWQEHVESELSLKHNKAGDVETKPTTDTEEIDFDSPTPDGQKHTLQEVRDLSEKFMTADPDGSYQHGATERVTQLLKEHGAVDEEGKVRFKLLPEDKVDSMFDKLTKLMELDKEEIKIKLGGFE